MTETIEIKTFYKLIGGINQLGVEVGSNVPKGGDAGAGGRTFLEISDQGGTAWDISIDGEKFSDSASVSITLGGDSELGAIIRALEFALAVLKKQEHDGESRTHQTVF